MQLNTISKLDILSALDINKKKLKQKWTREYHWGCNFDINTNTCEIDKIYDLAFVIICYCHVIMETIRKKEFYAKVRR